MEELLRTIVSQNERLHSVLDRMADKLEVLDEVADGIRSLESSILGALPSEIEVDLDSIVSSLSEIVEEIQWHRDLSAVSQLIKALEAVEEAVRMQR